MSYDIDNFSEIKVAFLQSWADAFVLQTVVVCLHLKVVHVLIELRSISSRAIDMILQVPVNMVGKSVKCKMQIQQYVHVSTGKN